jgi:hypothetical protein
MFFSFFLYASGWGRGILIFFSDVALTSFLISCVSFLLFTLFDFDLISDINLFCKSRNIDYKDDYL